MWSAKEKNATNGFLKRSKDTPLVVRQQQCLHRQVSVGRLARARTTNLFNKKSAHAMTDEYNLSLLLLLLVSISA
jgi:hypothetical protein